MPTTRPSESFRVPADLTGIAPGSLRDSSPVEVLTGVSTGLPKGQKRDYSQRRAVTGSTPVARYAGMQVAKSAAVLNTITADANTAGSRASTPNSKLPMKGVT